MKNISFAYTTPALLAGHKTVTRRDWDPSYANRFERGELVNAYNRSPRHHGEKVATLRIVSVTYEPNALAPASDYEAEGFAFLAAHPELLPKTNRLAYLDGLSRERFDYWRAGGGSMWVCRFVLVEIEPKWQAWIQERLSHVTDAHSVGVFANG